jgi:hypothetical protein
MYASLGPGLTLQGNSVRRSHLVIVDFALSLVKSEVIVTERNESFLKWKWTAFQENTS